MRRILLALLFALLALDTNAQASSITRSGDVYNLGIERMPPGIAAIIDSAGGFLGASAAAGLNSTGSGLIATAPSAQLDDVSPTSVTENNFAHIRMSADRALLTSSHPYSTDQTAETATSGNVANATAAATLATASGKTTFITGFQCSSGGATASADVDITVTGVITATLHYAFDSGTITAVG